MCSCCAALLKVQILGDSQEVTDVPEFHGRVFYTP
jgi:hypothetical protein